MKKVIFTGAAVAIVTPFHEDGSINFAMLENLIDYQIENSTDAIVICGTTGESPALDHEEHSEAIRRSTAMTLSLKLFKKMIMKQEALILQRMKFSFQTALSQIAEISVIFSARIIRLLFAIPYIRFILIQML